MKLSWNWLSSFRRSPLKMLMDNVRTTDNGGYHPIRGAYRSISIIIKSSTEDKFPHHNLSFCIYLFIDSIFNFVVLENEIY